MTIRFYRLNNTYSKNQINKTVPSSYIEINGELRDACDISNPTIIIDISSTASITATAPTQEEADLLKQRFTTSVFNAFNYVLIFELGRTYFVKKITLLRKNIISIDLHVDVLQSFQSFIYSQKAFISRNKTNYNKLLPDERRIVSNESEINFITLTNLTMPDIGFDTAFGTSTTVTTQTVYNFVVVSTNIQINATHIQQETYLTRAPNLLNLPDVRNCSFAPHSANVYILNREEIASLLNVLLHDDTKAGFVGTIFAYPFDFKDLYDSTSWDSLETSFLVGDTNIDANLTVHDNKELLDGYMKLANFIIPDTTSSSDFNDLEPYSIYELYIPYYGYYKLDYNALRGHEVYVYMTLNYEIGTATFLVYDKTKQQLITSLQVQVGIEIPKTITNLLEVKNRHEANNTSLGFSILASIISVIGGIATGGAGALLGVAGGALAGAKAIGSYEVSEKSNLISGSRLNFNGNTAPLFSPQTFYIRQTKRKIIYSLSSDFLNENGGVCNQLYTLSSLAGTGYTEVADIPNINYGSGANRPTDTETDEIITLLKNGVIF